MNSVLKNIKATLRQLFGFDEIEETKEWNDYLVALGQNGYFSSEEIEEFKKSDDYIGKLEKGLEEPENGSKKKAKSFQVNSVELSTSIGEKQITTDSNEKERE